MSQSDDSPKSQDVASTSLGSDAPEQPSADELRARMAANLRRRALRRLAVFLGVLLVAGVAWAIPAGKAAGLWLPDQRLRPLTHDPLAAKDLLGLSLIRAEDHAAAGFHNFLSPMPNRTAYVERRFTAGAGGPEATIEKISAFAEANGWEGEEGGLEYSLFNKELGGRTALLSIEYRDQGPAPGVQLHISYASGG
ncbi:MAG: hypothetical protein LBH68_08045 [Bifidobacteriaceae bacterium]|jgi:hypothetical protein|nr:hypothetical protein [Bifidobacteriaceae bacterium]